MENLVIESTLSTPSINFDGQKGSLYIKGKSISDKSYEFYKPLIETIQRYAQEPHLKHFIITIQLEWFNTSSSKCLLDIFREFEKIYKAGNKVKVIWYYEPDDEDMLDAGEDYQSIINLPFEFSEVEEA